MTYRLTKLHTTKTFFYNVAERLVINGINRT